MAGFAPPVRGYATLHAADSCPGVLEFPSVVTRYHHGDTVSVCDYATFSLRPPPAIRRKRSDMRSLCRTLVWSSRSDSDISFHFLLPCDRWCFTSTYYNLSLSLFFLGSPLILTSVSTSSYVISTRGSCRDNVFGVLMQQIISKSSKRQHAWTNLTFDSIWWPGGKWPCNICGGKGTGGMPGGTPGGICPGICPGGIPPGRPGGPPMLAPSGGGSRGGAGGPPGGAAPGAGGAETGAGGAPGGRGKPSATGSRAPAVRSEGSDEATSTSCRWR